MHHLHPPRDASEKPAAHRDQVGIAVGRLGDQIERTDNLLRSRLEPLAD
jgi:hypothetical protein